MAVMTIPICFNSSIKNIFKWIVHPKMKIVASFTHLHVVPNYDFLLQNIYDEVLRNVSQGPMLFSFSKHLILCTAGARKSYTFGMT